MKSQQKVMVLKSKYPMAELGGRWLQYFQSKARVIGAEEAREKVKCWVCREQSRNL